MLETKTPERRDDRQREVGEAISNVRRFGVQCAADLANVRSRHRRRDTCREAERGERAFRLAQLEEVSSARQALKGAEFAPGNYESHASNVLGQWMVKNIPYRTTI